MIASRCVLLMYNLVLLVFDLYLIMDTSFFLRSVIIGFTLAAAVGPISMLVIQRTLARGWVLGMASGLGVATADALFGLAGGLGLTAIAKALAHYDFWLRGAGGLVLIYLGIKIFTSVTSEGLETTERDRQLDTKGLFGAFTSIFLLTLANPLTIFSFAAVYTDIAADKLELTMNMAWVFAGSIFTGSGLWWLGLVSAVSLLRKKITPDMLKWINRIAGTAIVGFGVNLIL